MQAIRTLKRKNNPIPQDINHAGYLLTHCSEVPAKAQADALGVSYSRLVNCFLEAAPTANHLTEWVIPQTLAARNNILVQHICQQVGGVFVPVIDPTRYKGKARDLAEAFVSIGKEFGELGGAIQSVTRDGKISREEAAWVKKEAWDLVEKIICVLHRIDGEESA